MHTKDDDIYLYPVSCLFFSIFVVFYVRVIKRRYSEHFVRNRSAGRRGPDVVPGKSRIECVLSNTTESPNDKALLQWNNADQRTNERPTCFRPEKKKEKDTSTFQLRVRQPPCFVLAALLLLVCLSRKGLRTAFPLSFTGAHQGRTITTPRQTWWWDWAFLLGR